MLSQCRLDFTQQVSVSRQLVSETRNSPKSLKLCPPLFNTPQ